MKHLLKKSISYYGMKEFLTIIIKDVLKKKKCYGQAGIWLLVLSLSGISLHDKRDNHWVCPLPVYHLGKEYPFMH